MSLSIRGAALALALAGSVLVAFPAPAQAAPGNDDFADAQVVAPGGALVTGTTEDASPEDGEPDHADTGWGALHSVWYSWTPEESGVVPVSTCQSSFATRVGVYTGSSLATLTGPSAAEAAADGPCPGTAWGGLDVEVTAGTTYWIAVDTWGGVDADGDYEQSDRTTGEFQLQVGADGTVPMPVEKPVQVRVPDFRPICGTPKTKLEDCPDLQFRYMGKVLAWLKETRAKGGDVDLVPAGKSSASQDGAVLKYLRSKKATGGEVLGQNLKPGTYYSTVEEPLLLKVAFFDSFEDKAVQAATLETLEKAGEDNKDVKSPCEYIATDASRERIVTELNRDLGRPGLVTEADARRLLAQKGCGYEVTTREWLPGYDVDYVKDVTGVDVKRDLVKLHVVMPVAQDFLLVVREDPQFATTTYLGLGTDGKLTASDRQLSRITVQVIERATGRLVSGAKVSFVGDQGQSLTETTNAQGEWTFTSKLTRPDQYAIQAEVRGANGAVMRGYRSIEVVDRGTSSFVTMSGREMTYTNGDWIGTQADVDRARSLPVVPANLGTGLTGEPVAPPRIVQAQAAHPNADGTWTVGMSNSFRIDNHSSFAVGAAPGLVAVGGGLPDQVGRGGQRGWPNPFQAIADSVNYICTGLARAFDQAAGTLAAVATAAQQQAVRDAAEGLAANGASVPPSQVISDNGLGLISDKGLGVVSAEGAPVRDVSGLGLQSAAGALLGQANGKLIGQAGGNLIGQAGGNVISTGGLNATPVPGGNLISENGLG